MKICINCGVELDDSLNICPLCGKDPGNKDELKQLSDNKPSFIIELQKKENRRYLWELISVIAFSGIAVCTVFDLLIGKGLRWSLLSDVSILSTWAILTLYQFAHKRTLIIIISLLLITLAALLLIDLIVVGRDWFFPLGLPVTVAAFISIGIVTVLYKSVRLRGLNLIAVAFVVLSGFCILSEMVLDAFLNGSVHIHWSLFVAVSFLPVALVLSFYHFRLKKGNQLDSFFHI